MPTLNSHPERRPLPKHMLLADQLIKAARPHPHGQGSVNRYLSIRARLVAVKQTVSHRG